MKQMLRKNKKKRNCAIPEPVVGLQVSEKWHLFVQHKHGPLKFYQFQEAHTKGLPLVGEPLTSENAPCGSWAKQLPQPVLESVAAKTKGY